MDEITRLQSDLGQLVKRVDDMTLRLALVENEQKYVDEKISDIKVLIIEKNQDLRDDMTRDMKGVKDVIDKWNRLGGWLITLVGGTLILAVLDTIVKVRDAGGL